MRALEKAIEIDGTIDVNHHLILDNEDLPLEGPTRVKVFIKPVEKKGSGYSLNKLRGIIKNSKIDGLKFQKESRSEWDNRK